MKRMSSNILLVAITANTFAITGEQCHQAGFDEAFAKPCNEEMLGGILQRAQLRAQNVTFDPELRSSVTSNKESRLEAGAERDSTNAELATKPLELINRAEVLNLSGHDQAVLIEVLEIFVTSVTKDIAAIEQEYANGRWRQVEDLTHRIKGSVRYLGVSEVVYCAQQVEDATRRADSQQLSTQIPLLIKGVFQLRQEVEKWLEQLAQK